MNPGTYHTLADLVLIVHVLYVAFVVFGLVLIWWGGFRGWSWISVDSCPSSFVKSWQIFLGKFGRYAKALSEHPHIGVLYEGSDVTNWRSDIANAKAGYEGEIRKLYSFGTDK
ncbi:MAG TPA: hypothetical protein VG347_06075 [Verrucomicrobiae bacterium]|nr:hypothetical protein [Verrucomicrobiae bacterium]